MIPRPADALPTDPVFTTAITADGRFVFGQLGDAFSGLPRAFVYDVERDVVRVVQEVADDSVAFPDGAVLQRVDGVSHDGTVLVGSVAFADNSVKSYVLVVPRQAWETHPRRPRAKRHWRRARRLWLNPDRGERRRR